MRYYIQKLLPVLAISSLSALANDIEPGKEFYNATRSPGVIQLDGDLSEWVGVPVLADPKFAIPKGSGTNGTYVLFEPYQGGTWTGPDDQTSAVQVVWDEENLYIGIVVTDDYHENSANSPWNGDSAQLMIANGKRTTQVALYNYALGGVENALGDVIIQTEAGPGGTDAMITRNVTTKKTVYEIKMPAASLGLKTLTAGTKIGLGMAINDGDELTPGQKGWGGLGCHAIVFGKTPAQTAELTLSTNIPGADRLFFSAVNPSIEGFSFRTTDKGISVIDTNQVKLLIDSNVVALIASAKSGGSIDFTYIASTQFAPNSEHTYALTVKDVNGNTISDSGTFKTIAYAMLKAADKVTPDTSKRGFIWSIHENSALTTTDNVRPINQLAGLLGENFADPTAQGSAIAPGIAGANKNLPIKFEISSVINFTESSGSTAGNDLNDTVMPGLPGTSGSTDGVAVDILTYLELTAGKHTLIVNSDDGFRTTAGTVSDAFQAQLAGEFATGRGSADTAFTVYAAEDGVYAFRTVYENGASPGNIELLSTKADGTKVLLNDTANGGLKAYRAITSAAGPAISRVSPPIDATDVAFDAPVSLAIQDSSIAVDTASVKLSIDGAQVNAPATKSNGETTLTYQPANYWASGSQHTASISFTAGGTTRTESWKFAVIAYATLSKAQQAVSVDTSKPGFTWYVFQNENYQQPTLAQTETALAGQLRDSSSNLVENLADPLASGVATGAGVKVGSLYKFEIPTVINLSQAGGDATGKFTPDDQMPGIPGTTGLDDGIEAQVISFVDLPAGVITMGVVSDDSFRVQAGYINVPADGTLLGQADNSTADVTFKFLVKDAGIYPLRAIWQEGGGGANLELSTIKTDGTRVLLNDTANGGYKTYRVGVAPSKPSSFSLGVQIVSGKVQISWTESAAVLQQSANLKDWTDVTAAISPYLPSATTSTFFRLKE